MSPLMIILLMLILVIGSTHQIIIEKYRVKEGSRRFPRIVDHNSSLVDSLNYVTINTGKNDRDPSTMRNNQLRQNLQHLLTSVVKKIILQRLIKPPKKTDYWMMNRKISGKTLESNKIPIGEFPEDNNTLERGRETNRGNLDFTSVFRRNSGSEVREKIAEDLIQISDAIMPTVRRLSDSGFMDPQNYTDPTTAPIERRDKRETVENTRVKKAIFKQNQQNITLHKNWLQSELDGPIVNNLKMQALIVKDEVIPPCCEPAKPESNRRFFMCSGAILSPTRAITSASCVHFADIHESNDDATLAVHVGNTDGNSYVIRIYRYEMHPDYEFDVDSKNHATYNLAVLYLACSIVPDDVVVPKLPKGYNDDIGHVCCRENCDLISIMILHDNSALVHSLPAKYLPAPVHDDDHAFYSSRSVRSPSKLAAAPTFFRDESPRRTSRLQNAERLAESSIGKKRKKTKLKQKTILRNQQQSKTSKMLFNIEDLLTRRMMGKTYMSVLRALEKQGVNVAEQLAAVDWENIQETMENKISPNNRKKMETFARNIVAETIKRIGYVLGDGKTDKKEGEPGYVGYGENSRVFESLMPNKDKNKTIENFVHVFAKVVSSLLPPNTLSDSKFQTDDNVEEKDLTDPPPRYKKCPPIGTPVFANGTLLGLVCYSCDDLQDWVEWKYVNIAKNLKWIETQIRKQPSGAIQCTEASKPTDRNQKEMFSDDFSIAEIRQRKQSETEIPGTKVEWNRQDESSEVQRIFSPGNLDHARDSESGTYLRYPKDPWFARNSPPTPQVQREYEPRKIFTDSRNQPQAPTRDERIFNMNACYVGPDGTTTCQSKSHFSIP